jgi:ElaB/YqjD/DUF883 family membrane-anchored ribosome-binding protein
MSTTTTQSIAKAVGNAYDDAGKTIHDIGNSASRLQDTLEPVIHQVTAKAQKLMNDSLEMASDTKHSVEKALRDASHATSKYVSDQPLKSVCIAAGVGAATALLVYALRRGNDKSC